MNDDEKDKIVEKEESVSDLEQSKVEKQPLDESKANNDEKSENLPEGHSEDNKIQESKKEHQVIHKKEGRLHIYVRQDKYKGELKSKNWVGRIYIDGKQKISSSGTPNLEEAIPILEKWFEDIHAQKEKEKNSANLESPSVPAQPTSEQTEKIPTAESTKQTEIKQSGNISMSSKNDDVSEKKSLSNILEKFKSIKF